MQPGRCRIATLVPPWAFTVGAEGSTMGLIKLIAAPIRSLLRFPLFQLGVVFAVILYFQAADDNTLQGKLFDGLDKLTEDSVQLISQLFTVKSFTRSVLSAGLMI